MRWRRPAVPRASRRAAAAARPAPTSGPPSTRPGRSRFDRLGRFFAAITALCAVASLPNSSAFALASVSVRGNAAVSAAEVLGRIGLGPGDSAFRVNAWDIRRRVLEDPRVADASVALSFPSALVVSIRERDPVAALALPDGYVEIAADGVAISHAPSVPRGLPLEVTPLGLPWLQFGSTVPSADVRFGAAVAAGLAPALRSLVAGLRVESGELVLVTRDGTSVKAGSQDGLDARLALAPGVLAAVRARGIRARYVDLRVPGGVVVLPVPPAPTSAANAAPADAPSGAPAPPSGQENPAHR